MIRTGRLVPSDQEWHSAGGSMSPKPATCEILLDPACGTGGFLVEALTHIMGKLEDEARTRWHDPDAPSDEERATLAQQTTTFAAEHIYGVDFDPDLVKATQMNMVMNNDGQGHLFAVNSLDNPHNWPNNVQRELRFDAFDVILTNPPFGSKLEIDDPAILQMYDLARRWERRLDGSWWPTAVLQKKMPPEILFIERCWRFLKPGTGRMGIVLPDGILSNPDLEYVRAWILRNCRVLASIDLPVETFLPHTGTQTSMLFLQRKPKSAGLYSQVAGDEEEYRVFMAIAERVGKDRRANPIYKRDPHGNELWFDVSEEERVWVEEPVAGPLFEIDADPGRSLRERNGHYYVRHSMIQHITRKTKMLDDDLPEIARAFRRFVEEHEVED